MINTAKLKSLRNHDLVFFLSWLLLIVLSGLYFLWWAIMLLILWFSRYWKIIWQLALRFFTCLQTFLILFWRPFYFKFSDSWFIAYDYSFYSSYQVIHLHFIGIYVFALLECQLVVDIIAYPYKLLSQTAGSYYNGSHTYVNNYIHMSSLRGIFRGSGFLQAMSNFMVPQFSMGSI